MRAPAAAGHRRLVEQVFGRREPFAGRVAPEALRLRQLGGRRLRPAAIDARHEGARGSGLDGNRACARGGLRAPRRRELGPVRQPSHRGAARRQRALAHRAEAHRRGDPEEPGRSDRGPADHRVGGVRRRRRPRVHEPVPEGRPRCAPRALQARPEHRHAHDRRCRGGAGGRARAGASRARPQAPVDGAGGGRRAEHRQPQRDARQHRRARPAARSVAARPLPRAGGGRAAPRAGQAPDGGRARRGSGRGRRAARGRVLRGPLDRGGPRRRPGRAGGSPGGLGRLPRRPSHRRLDTRRVRCGGGGRGGVADRAASLRRATARGGPLACNGAAASRHCGCCAEWPSRQPECWCSSSETPSLLS